MNALFLLLFAIVPNDHVLHDNFDKVEVNHFYDDQGRHVFDQVLWYDWEKIYNRHTVHAWRLVKLPGQIPTLNRDTDLYESLFDDHDNLRKVTAKYMVETWTQFDPELIDREFLPKERRRELSHPQNTKKSKELIQVIFGVFR